jgi:hypothetical protein
VRIITSAAAALAVLVLTVAPADGTIQKYFDGTFAANGYAHPASNYWTTNRVWRPIGDYFALWFYNSTNNYAGFAEDYQHNPFTITGPYGYSQAYCENDNQYGVSTVTCQAYT